MRDTRVDLTLASSTGRTPFLTYEPYYGLKEKPFSLSSDPRFLYKSPGHASVYDDLRDGIRRREGLIVLTGDIGTGKTTLCRSVLKDLDRKTFSTFVPDPFLSREDLLKILLLDFGVMSVDDLQSGRLSGVSRPDLSYPLYEFLKSLVPLQAYAVLVIDEAQNLSLSLLEEIRILSDLEGPEKLLQVVLIGQLELLPKLKDRQMRQVDQRVTVRCQLKALDRGALPGYIEHRLGVAGAAADRVTFSESALDVVYGATRGNPRLINVACDRALHHGHLARASIIGPDLARKALDELGVNTLTPAPAAAPEDHPELQAFRAELPVAIDSSVISAAPALQVPPDPKEDEAQEKRRPAFRRVASLLLLLIVSVMLLSSWQRLQAVGEDVTMPAPPGSPRKHVGSHPKGPIASTVVPASPAPSFEVGVALFITFERASRLEAELIAAGYRSSVWAVELATGRMYEVRTGPYSTREAAITDVARIRARGGYTDARIIPPSNTSQ